MHPLCPAAFSPFRPVACLLVMLCVFSSGQASAVQEGVILQEEIVTSERQLQPEGTTPRQHPTENLINSMDVYALSPHAAELILPRMVTIQMARRMHDDRTARPTPTLWQEIINRASQIYHLAPELIAAVIRVESDFNPGVVSNKGAQGAMQLMPDMQQELGVVDPFDPEANVLAGCAYLRQQLDRFGSLELALAAYNAGPGNVLKYGGIPPFTETRNYVRKVLSDLSR